MLTVLFQLFSLLLHIGENGTFPKPLTAQEEKELLYRYRNGDEAARQKLIEHNLRLVAHIVKKYYVSAEEQDDLISIGTIGLIKGIDSYKSGKKTKLATYVAKCIENEILMYFRKKKKTAGDISLNEHIDTDKDGNELSLIDVIPDDERILDEVYGRMQVDKLMKGIDAMLDSREKKIIYLRYGITEPPLTQKQTAERLNVSRSYISRLEKKALQTLKTYMNKNEL